MQPLVLTLLSLIAAGAAAFVAKPLLRGQPPPRTEQDTQHSLGLSLLERRDHALAALKELEFDHRTGKLSDGDYRSLVGPLRSEAAQTLRLLAQQQPVASPNMQLRDRVPPRGASRTKRTVPTHR
jgi:hypothetical protein